MTSTAPTLMNNDRSNRDLRVSVNDGDLGELMAEFPKLARTEIADIISRSGPMRDDVLNELRRLSAHKN